MWKVAPGVLAAAALGAAASGAPIARTGASLDITHAVVVTASQRGVVERTASRMLVEEFQKRSGVKLRVATKAPASGPVIFLGMRGNLPVGTPGAAAGGVGRLQAEGYTLQAAAAGGRPVVCAIGADGSGAVFAAGRLLREIRAAGDRVTMPETHIVTSPASRIRGHQIGWRPTANSYDLWTVAQFEQYVRDLAVWGTNAIELIPSTPDWTLEKTLTMNVKFADIIASYGMQVWIWYPFDDMTPPGTIGKGLTPGIKPCPSQADGRRFLLANRRKLFQRFKHLDGVFVPGGDPAGCDCKLCRPWVHTMLPMCGEMAAVLKEVHPHAQLWLSNQGFREADNAWFYRYLQTKRPAWLAGLVYGPWAEETVFSMRKQAPKQYPIRLYPDITHTVRCQYPARDWDVALAQTLGREPAMYRVTEQAHIARMYQSVSCGSGSYSDGVNDDIHKAIWSAVLWDPKADGVAIAREYARYFLGAPYEDAGARGFVGFEKAWKAPFLTNASVEENYTIWTDMASQGGPVLAKNWRFQMALLRATYDRFVQHRLKAETAVQDAVLRDLAADPDPAHAVEAGLAAVQQALTTKPEPETQEQLLALGQALYESIGMQLSVKRWGAAGGERGAILDYLDAPISNLGWLREELGALRAASDPAAVRAGIDRLVNWENPGPGGFYDDLGNPTKQPHLIRQRTWEQDPGYVESTRLCFTRAWPAGRISWFNYAETLYGVPILMHYDGLDRSAQYVVRAVYSGRYKPVMTLVANDRYTVHGPLKQPEKPVVQEWPVPRAATATGSLTLKWFRTVGRGSQVSEVWLIRK